VDEKVSVAFGTLPLGDGRVLKVGLRGNLRHGDREDLKAIVFDRLEPDTRGVIVDLSQIGRIDSCGLGVLAGLQSLVAQKGVRLVLVGLSVQLQGIFRTSGMIDLFVELESEKDALRYLQQS